MDVSPKYWLKSRTDEKNLRKYIFEKFERDCHPRII